MRPIFILIAALVAALAMTLPAYAGTGEQKQKPPRPTPHQNNNKNMKDILIGPRGVEVRPDYPRPYRPGWHRGW